MASLFGKHRSLASAMAALAAIVCVHPSSAQDVVTAIAGAGSRSCGQMQMDVADLPNVRRAYVSWMQGYLSARNAAREIDGRALVDIADYEAQWTWIVDWCAARPDESFGDAVGALFAERASSAEPEA